MIYLQSKYDIRTRPADEIKDFERVPRNLVIRFAHNNIRSFICRRHISSTVGGYHIEDISPVPQGTDIIEKPTCRNKSVFLYMGYEKDIFMVCIKDSNPNAKSRRRRVYHQFRRNCISSKRSFVYHHCEKKCSVRLMIYTFGDEMHACA